MSSASAFANWLQLNRTARLTPADQIVNDAQRNTYLLGEILKVNGPKASVRSGTYIEERIRLSKQGNFRSFDPGEERSTTRRQTIKTIQFGWRFHENDLPYTDAELDLSQGDEFTVFKNFKASLDADLAVDHWEGLENLLFARPDSSLMESTSIKKGKAFSIPALISENATTFLPPSTSTGTGPVWSAATLAGLTVAGETNYQNQQQTYDSSAISDPTNGLMTAFDKMFLKVQFMQPTGGAAKYYENDVLRGMKILTNLDGRAIYMGLLRSGNDQFRAGPQDPAYGTPVYMGVPVMYINQLDTELLNEVAGVYQESVYPTGKPRFFWPNLNYLRMVFHPKHFMKEVDPINGGIKQRDAWSLFKESWTNLAWNSRRRHGIVYPA